MTQPQPVEKQRRRELPSSVLASIENRYALKNNEEVKEYITKHPELVNILLDAPSRIRHYFGDRKLSVKVTPSLGLFINIITDQPSQEAHELMRKMDREWWIEASDPYGDLIEITLERCSVV